MELSYLLFLHAHDGGASHDGPSTRTPRPEDPQPGGAEEEPVGEEDDDAEEDIPPTLPERRDANAPPMKQTPAAPDANPIDPRVF